MITHRDLEEVKYLCGLKEPTVLQMRQLIRLRLKAEGNQNNYIRLQYLTDDQVKSGFEIAKQHFNEFRNKELHN